MAIKEKVKKNLGILKKEYNTLSVGKDSLLTLLNETELTEGVFNSNAIENSTLTLKETETILLDREVPRKVQVREMYEVKNLAKVMAFTENKGDHLILNPEVILKLHQMLLDNINDRIAGRFRGKNEYVRIGNHIAPPPEHVERMMEHILREYKTDTDSHPVEKISRFHLDFETIHPFNDGNSRMGRIIINHQLNRVGYPNIILRDKGKTSYYRALREYNQNGSTAEMENILTLALMESLHKRITYLRDKIVIPLSEFAKTERRSLNSLINMARRQTITAFRERGIWKIGRGD